MTRDELLTKLAREVAYWPKPTTLRAESPSLPPSWDWSCPDGKRVEIVSHQGLRPIIRAEWLARRMELADPTPEEDAAWQEAEARMERIGRNGGDGLHYAEDSDAGSALSQAVREGKQARYQDAAGEDWIDEFARTATAEEFRGAMRFTIGKYNRRVGKKDAITQEIRKMRDYCDRWLAYEEGDA